MNHLKEIIPLLLIVASVVVGYAYLPGLPDRVAIHFNAKGEPDNWMGKVGAIWIGPIFALLFYAGFTWLQVYFPSVYVWKTLIMLLMASAQLSTIFYALEKVKGPLTLMMPSIILLIIYGLYAMRKSFM